MSVAGTAKVSGAKNEGAWNVAPGYLTWKGLARYSSCSKRWLQTHVPHSLRFRVDGKGKVLILIRDFDAWMERHRGGQDLDRVLGEVLGGLDTSKR